MLLVEFLHIAGVELVVGRANLRELAMQVDDVLRTGLLVQVVDILRDDRNVVEVLQLGHQPMAFVGLSRVKLTPQHVVEIGDKGGVGQPTLVCGNLLYGIILPEPIGASERLEAALYGHAGSCKENDFLHRFVALNY